MKLKRRKVEDGAYDLVDQSGTVVGRVEEWGVRGYRWHVTPADRAIRGWDSASIGDAAEGLARTIEKRAAEGAAR